MTETDEKHPVRSGALADQAHGHTQSWDKYADGWFKFVERLLMVGALAYVEHIVPKSSEAYSYVLSLSGTVMLAFTLWTTWFLISWMAPFIDVALEKTLYQIQGGWLDEGSYRVMAQLVIGIPLFVLVNHYVRHVLFAVVQVLPHG